MLDTYFSVIERGGRLAIIGRAGIPMHGVCLVPSFRIRLLLKCDGGDQPDRGAIASGDHEWNVHVRWKFRQGVGPDLLGCARGKLSVLPNDTSTGGCLLDLVGDRLAWRGDEFHGSGGGPREGTIEDVLLRDQRDLKTFHSERFCLASHLDASHIGGSIPDAKNQNMYHLTF